MPNLNGIPITRSIPSLCVSKIRPIVRGERSRTPSTSPPQATADWRRAIDRIFETQSEGIDLVIGIPFKFGVGYSLYPTEGRVCAWGGMGGSTVIIDVDRRITFAYVMNKLAPAAVIAPALAQRVADIVKR